MYLLCPMARNGDIHVAEAQPGIAKERIDL